MRRAARVALRQPQGKLSFWSEVLLDEFRERCRQLVTGNAATARNLAHDFIRDILGPSLGCVEGNNASWVIELT